jgi:hypothetical protein
MTFNDTVTIAVLHHGRWVGLSYCLDGSCDWCQAYGWKALSTSWRWALLIWTSSGMANAFRQVGSGMVGLGRVRVSSKSVSLSGPQALSVYAVWA